MQKVLTMEGHYIKFERADDMSWLVSEGIERMNEDYEITLRFSSPQKLTQQQAVDEMDKFIAWGYESTS